MEKVKFKGKNYFKYDNGVMVPAFYIREKRKITGVETVLPLLAEIQCREQEIFLLITLDGSNQVIKIREITSGLVNQGQTHPREVFRPAITDNAVSILIAHNHPSGHSSASSADIKTTERLIKASKIIGIPILDHVIICPAGSHTSIRERYPEIFLF